MSRNVRGVLFIDYVKMLRRQKAVVRAQRFLEPEDERYLTEHLELDGWYPMETFERLGLAILAEVVGAEVDAIRLWGRQQLAALLTFFPDLSAACDPRDAVMRFQAFMRSLFSFPCVNLESVDDESAIVTIDFGMSPQAEAAASWQAVGFFEELVTSSGGRGVRSELVDGRATLRWTLGTPVPAPLVHPRVLLVDDESLVLDALERFLRNHAILTTARSMPEALKLLATQTFDAILADHVMGKGGSGVELLTEVSQRWPRVRRVLHTGHLPPVDSLVTYGVIHQVLEKPAPLDELLSAIRTPTPRDP